MLNKVYIPPRATITEIQIAKQIQRNALPLTTNVILLDKQKQCPTCSQSYNSWHILPPIYNGQPKSKKHIVKYKCDCGTVFLKVEEL